MSVRRTPAGKWIIDYYPDGRHGKRVRLTFPDSYPEEQIREIERDARKLATQIRNAGTVAGPSATINELVPDYLAWVDLHRRKTTANERRYTIKHIQNILGYVRASRVSSNHVQIYQGKRKSEGASNKTVNKECYYLTAFLRWCRETASIDVPPVTVKKLRYERPVPVVLSPGEVVRIIEAAEGVYRPLFVTLYTLGLRISEATGLTWDDIDFANRTVRTEQKGGTYKVLPLNDWLERELKVLGDPIPGKRVFKSRIQGKRIVNVRKALASAVKRAGITKRVYPHLFRHSVATHFLGADVNLRKIQVYLGHKDIDTTQFYTHVVASDLGKAANDMFDNMVVTTPNPLKIRRKQAPVTTSVGKRKLKDI